MGRKRITITIKEEVIDKFDKKIKKMPRDKLPKRNRSQGIEKVLKRSMEELEDLF